MRERERARACTRESERERESGRARAREKERERERERESGRDDVALLVLVVPRGGGLGSRPIFKKFNEPYAPS